MLQSAIFTTINEWAIWILPETKRLMINDKTNRASLRERSPMFNVGEKK
jgi:hypothetical protein